MRKVQCKKFYEKLGPPLCWNDLAEIYDNRYFGQKARTLSMDVVFDRVSQDTKNFYVCPDEGTIHRMNSCVQWVLCSPAMKGKPL